MLKRVMRLDVLVACFYMHARRVGIVNLDAEEHQNRAAMLCTRVYLHAYLDLIGDPLQDTCQRTRPRFIS